MVDRSFIVRNAANFSEHNAENSLPLPRNNQKTKIIHSVCQWFMRAFAS